LISTDLLGAACIEYDAGSNKALSIAKIYAADATIREVSEETSFLWELFSKDHKFKLWDVTSYPPKDITSWPTVDYPELTGSKSKTLQDAGYFPSGNWLVLPPDVLPSQFSTADYDDVQYNKHAGDEERGDGSKSTILEFADGSSAARPLPSQVMGSVTKRFETEEQLEKATNDEAIQLRIQNQVQRRKIELDRAKKLDERIKKLEENTSEKNKNVSDQVRRMLVKSRATGDKKLKMQDRVYFQCMLDDDGALTRTLTKEFRFFSPQDTFARIAASFSSKQGCTNSEVLIKRKDPDDASVTTYRRFPVAMRVYEAIADTYLTDQMDTMVVRWYPDGQSSTPSILEGPSSDQTASSGDVRMEDATSSQPPANLSQDMTTVSTATASASLIEDTVLSDAIRAMEEAENKGKKPKKKSASALKVRNMQMKAKAKGDTKRVPKVEDRFFLQVVLVDSTWRATSNPYFLARTDALQRLLSSISTIKDPSKWEFIVPQETANMFRVISEGAVILKDAEAAGILNCFDRIILCPKLSYRK
jgi:hypothetical protein